jgi:phage terminase large subunit-like protein
MFYVDSDAAWYDAFLAECLGFPNSTYKDQVDALAIATHLVFEHPIRTPRAVTFNPGASSGFRRTRPD